MANEFFQAGSVPQTNSLGASAQIRGEFARIAAGFDKLAPMAGYGGTLIRVNNSGTAMSNSRISDDGTTAAVDGDEIVTATASQVLTGKTLSWSGNTFSGFGDAATKAAGTGADEVLLLTVSGQLPAMDASLLTGISVGSISGVLGVEKGGTGANTLEGAQIALGIATKAEAHNSVLTGAPVAPNPPTNSSGTQIATTFFVQEAVAQAGGLTPSDQQPWMNGVGDPGVGIQAARDDHVHPTDTSRAPLVSPSFTGPVSISANSTQAALKLTQTGTGYAFLVEDAASDTTPFVIDGGGLIGIGAASSGASVSIASQNTFSASDATNTSGLHVQGLGTAGVGAYGGAITLAQTGGSSRPGAGIASIQSTSDPDQCGLAILVHSGATSTNILAKVGEIDYLGRLGLGVSPQAPFHVSYASNEIARFANTIAGGSSGYASFYNTDAVRVGWIGYGSASDTVFHIANAISGGQVAIYAGGAERLIVDPTDGVSVNAGLSISKASVTAPASTDGNVFSGTYTPTLTNVANVDSSTAAVCQYMRVGNVVTVSGSISVNPTTAGAAQTIVRISLPVASNLTALANLAGTAGTAALSSAQPSVIYADTTNDAATFVFYAGASGSQTWLFHFTYRVL